MTSLEVIAKLSGFAGYAGFLPAFSEHAGEDACAPMGFAITSLFNKYFLW